MPARTLMTQRASTERGADVSDGGGGYAEVYTPLLTDVPCRWAPISNAETLFSSQMGTNPTGRLFMPLGMDVSETDRIVAVTDRRGRPLAYGPLRVEAVIRRQDHLELYCTAREGSSTPILWDAPGSTPTSGGFAGVDGTGPWIDDAVPSTVAGVDGTGPWIDGTVTSTTAGVDVTGPWIESV
jgi:hypothetical protein